jgi:hypothetical protein
VRCGHGNNHRFAFHRPHLPSNEIASGKAAIPEMIGARLESELAELGD